MDHRAAVADAALAARTRNVYERNADRFDRERSRDLFERPWLDRFRALLPPDGPVLDVGCGTGDPVGTALAAAGHPVLGVDFAAAMLAVARRRFPGRDFRHADMRSLDLSERFDGLVAWDSFFHLTPDEQVATLPRLAAHLRPGGALLMTVGPGRGETAGRVGGDPVYHASLSPERYEALLAASGLGVVAFVPADPGCAGHSVLLARDRGTARG